MTSTTTQTLNSCSNYTDDMPVYVSIFERPKKPKERAKTTSMKYYADNHDYCVLMQFIYDEKKKK